MTGGRTRWGLVAALVALPVVLVIGPVVVEFATEDYPLGGGPEKVSCVEALEFGGARLPEGAYDAECTVQVWMDTRYLAEFRMPRDQVDGWLGSTYPDAERKTEFCADDTADLCLGVGFVDGVPEEGEVPGTVYPGFGAHGVHVSVDHESADTTRVTFSALTV